MRRVGHVARMGEEKKITRFRWEIPKERDHSENGVVDGRLGLKYILERLARGFGVNSVGLEKGPVETVMNVVMNLRFLASRS
jgi:hypothetical protein